MRLVVKRSSLHFVKEKETSWKQSVSFSSYPILSAVLLLNWSSFISIKWVHIKKLFKCIPIIVMWVMESLTHVYKISLKLIHFVDMIRLILCPLFRNSTNHLTVIPIKIPSLHLWPFLDNLTVLAIYWIDILLSSFSLVCKNARLLINWPKYFFYNVI